MKIRSLLAVAILLLPVTAGGATAASSRWEEVEGGRMRLVVEDGGGSNATLRAVLQVELRPGWKTYWRDPGDSGIPPTLASTPESDFAVEYLEFPAPEWIDDGSSTWAGYRHSVDLPVTLAAVRARASRVVVDAFIGICETICIPFQARFDVSISSAASTPDGAFVAEAFAKLPSPADADFGVVGVARSYSGLAVTTKGAEGPSQLFLAGKGGYAFGRPIPLEDGSGFTVKIVARPKNAGAPVEIPYTLVSGTGAVSGTFSLE